MKVLRSHKTLFRNAAILGLIVSASSIGLFLTFGQVLFEGPLQYGKKEADNYFSHLQHGASRYMDRSIDRTADILYKSLDSGDNRSQALRHAVERLDADTSAPTYCWLTSPSSNDVIAYPSEKFKVPEAYYSLAKKDSSLNRVIYQGACYLLSTKIIGPHKMLGDRDWVLVLAEPATQVYHHLDWSDRFRGITIADNEPRAQKADTELASIIIKDTRDKRIGYARVKMEIPGLANGQIWRWQVALLGLLPLICVAAFIYLIYRYLVSFSDHSLMLNKLLRSDRAGVEIFRRDEHIMQKFMPELSELFSLAGESAAEKMYFKKSFEQFGMALEVIEDKGFDNKAVCDVLEFLLRGLPDCGGAVLSAVQSNEPSIVLGRYNINDDLIDKLSSTSRGISILKFVGRQSSSVSLVDISGTPGEMDLKDLFDKFNGVQAYPLRLKGRTIAVLILLSSNGDQNSQYFSSIPNLIMDLLAILTFGVLLERDKLSRAEGTRILQDTSLAISSTLDLPSVLRIVAHRLTDYAEAAYCMILLNVVNSDEIEVASFFNRRREGISAPAIDKIILAEFPGLAKAVKSNRATVLEKHDIDDFSKEERAFINASSIESLTILPIAHSAKFIGSIVLGEQRTGAKGAVGSEKLIIIQSIASQAASAIENARLYGFIKQKVDQLTASYNVSAVINSEIDIDHMLARVLEATKEYLNFSYSIIFGVNDEKRILIPMAYRGFRPDITDSGIKTKANDSVAGLVASTGESVIIDDTRLDAKLKASFPGALSELAVPIKISDKVVGIFSVGSDIKNAFSGLDEEFLHSLAAQIAVAMGKARLFEQEKERSKRLKTIYEFSRQTSKTLNLEEVLELAVDSIRDAFKYQLVLVILRDKESGGYYLARESSIPSVKFSAPDFKIKEGSLLGRTVNVGRTLYCADTFADTDYTPAAANLRSEVCVPIISGDKIIGVIGLGSTSTDNFTTEDINTIEALSDILAVAIAKAYLFRETIEKAERLSLMDKINTAISTALDLDSFFKAVAKAVSDNAGYRWTLLIVPDGNSFSCKAGYAPKSSGDLKPNQIIEILHERLAQVFTTKTAEFVSFADLASLGKPEKLQPAVDAGIRHLVLLPIGEAEKCDAVLTVGSSSKDGFSTQELSLLHDIAVHLQIAWQNASLYEQLKTAYKQLQEAQDQVVQTEKLRALGEMSSGVVHDFNNILAAILGRVELMIKKMSGMSDEQWLKFFEKNLSVIETAVKDGSSILSRISEFTKKKPTEKFVALRVDQIIADVIEMTKPRWYNQAIAKGKKINLIYDCKVKLPAMGSPSELREVFTNLINNAVDAMQKGGQINISACIEREDKIIVSLEDTGHGMPEEIRKKIFEPFFTTKGKSGTGLGLSVTYGIIGRHGGTIEVESQIGKGTKFKITLPLGKEVGSVESTVPKEEVDTVNGRILVVDDEENLRDILSEILDSVGHEVDTASGGIEAMEMISKKKYDLVITDLGMDDMSGWEVADECYLKYPDIKIVLATGWAAQVEPGNLAMHHVNSMINKPFKIAEIARIVGQVLLSKRDEVLIDKV